MTLWIFLGEFWQIYTGVCEKKVTNQNQIKMKNEKYKIKNENEKSN